VRMVVYRAESVAQGVAQLAAFVDAARCLRSHMRANATRKRELLEESLHAFDVLTFVRVHFAVDAFEILDMR
jgi:hypothetical protein